MRNTAGVACTMLARGMVVRASMVRVCECTMVRFCCGMRSSSGGGHWIVPTPPSWPAQQQPGRQPSNAESHSLSVGWRGNADSRSAHIILLSEKRQCGRRRAWPLYAQRSRPERPYQHRHTQVTHPRTSTTLITSSSCTPGRCLPPAQHASRSQPPARASHGC